MPSGVYDHHKTRKDLTGKKFGRLTVLSFHHSNDGAYWLCECECGERRVVNSYSLTSGHTKSCGCYNREISGKKSKERAKRNRYEIDGGVVKVFFDNVDEYFICDADDLELVNSGSWYKGQIGYAYSNARENTTFHKELMKPPQGMVVDHINRNKLDNRKSNLRIVTQASNTQNSDRKRPNKTGYHNVYYRKQNDKYVGVFTMNKKKYQVGTFKTPYEAYLAVEKRKEEMNYGGF